MKSPALNIARLATANLGYTIKPARVCDLEMGNPDTTRIYLIYPKRYQGDSTLTIKFESGTYTIAYDHGGGGGSIDTTSSESEALAILQRHIS